MLVVEDGMMPDKLEQYLITEHMEHRYDQETDLGKMFGAVRGPCMNNFRFAQPKLSLSISKTCSNDCIIQAVIEM